MVQVPQASKICYGGKGEQQYGVFNAPKLGIVLRFILINMEGGFYCSSTSVSKSIWGCLSQPDIVVTDSRNAVLKTSRIMFRIWTSESLVRTTRSNSDVTGSHCVQISMGYLSTTD